MKALLLLTVAVIFAGTGFFKKLRHKHRMRRNDRHKKKCESEYKRRFAENQADITRWHREGEDNGSENVSKGISVTCKNPVLAPIFKGALLR